MANYYDKEVERAQRKWQEAKARGDKQGMSNAHAHAEKMRQQSRAWQASRGNTESTKQGWHSSESPTMGVRSSREKRDYSQSKPDLFGRMRDVFGNSYSRSYTQGANGRIYGGIRRIDQEGYRNYQNIKNQGRLGEYAYDNVMYRDPYGETVQALRNRGIINPYRTKAYEIDPDNTGRWKPERIGEQQALATMQELRNQGYSEEQIKRMVRSTGEYLNAYNLKDSNTISKYVNQRNHADNERYRSYHQKSGDWDNPYVDEAYEQAYKQGYPKPPTDREWTIDDYVEPPDPSKFKRETPLQGNVDYSTKAPNSLDNQRRYLQSLIDTGNAGQQKWARAEMQKLLSQNAPSQGNNFGYGSNQSNTGNQTGSNYNPFDGMQNIPSLQSYMNGLKFPEQTNNLEYFKEAANQMNIANRAATDSAVARLEATRAPLEQSYEDNAKQAYISSMLAKRDLDEQLNAQGLSGGATESALANVETSYQNALNQSNREKANALNKLNSDIAQARATGAMELAKTLAGYYEQMAQAGIQQDNMKFNQAMQMADMAMRQRQSDIDTMMNRQNMAMDWMKYNRGNFESDREFDYRKQQQDWENAFNREKFDKQFGLNSDKFAYQQSRGGRRGGGGRRRGRRRSGGSSSYDFGWSEVPKPQQKEEKKNKISPEALKMLLSLNSKRPFGWMPTK
jgi:hypothetical protein